MASSMSGISLRARNCASYEQLPMSSEKRCGLHQLDGPLEGGRLCTVHGPWEV